MKKVTCFFRLILPIIVFQLSFNASVSACQHANAKTHKKLLKTTIADAREDHYDLKYTKLTIALNNNNTNIAGSVVYYAVVSNPLMNEYVFELLSTLQIDSIFVNNQLCTYTRNANVVTVPLSSAMTAGTFFTTKIVYHGSPTSGTGFFSAGINAIASPTWGNKVTYTLSASYHGFEWFPCKQSLKDKIDSSSVWIIVPDSLKAGSNGLLNKVTSLPNNLKRFEWSTKYPIDYYLISVSVANYVDYSYYMHFDNSTDSMLIQNYVYNNPATLPTFKSVIDSTELMINQLSNLFGRYPFHEEKYGHCMAPLSGGMEHQTMTTLGFFNGTLVVHELGHQWFGDYVTCANWGDIWLNEGFASYVEQLYVNKFYTPAKAFNYRSAVHNRVMQQAGGSVFCNDTTDENRIYDSRLTYDKGAAVLHMLRYLAPKDSLFFAGIKNYLSAHAFSNATTSDLKTALSTIYQKNLDTFFNQWVYGEGYPTYSAEWNQQINGSNYDFVIKLNQTTSMPSSVAAFNLPLPVLLRSPQGDTMLYLTFNTATATYNWPTNTFTKTISSVEIDPSNWIINKTGPIIKNTALNIPTTVYQTLKVAPNPTKDVWHINQVAVGTSLQLIDINGKLLWNETATSGEIQIPAKNLTPGMYILIVKDATANQQSIQLIKE